jgi:hypothetical protein
VSLEEYALESNTLKMLESTKEEEFVGKFATIGNIGNVENTEYVEESDIAKTYDVIDMLEFAKTMVNGAPTKDVETLKYANHIDIVLDVLYGDTEKFARE